MQLTSEQVEVLAEKIYCELESAELAKFEKKIAKASKTILGQSILQEVKRIDKELASLTLKAIAELDKLAKLYTSQLQAIVAFGKPRIFDGEIDPNLIIARQFNITRKHISNYDIRAEIILANMRAADIKKITDTVKKKFK